jgi:hypothetical protein
LQRVLPVFGMMRSLVSDRDPRFTSVFWKQLCQVLRIKLKMSTPRHPQTDGQSEEAIRWIKQILRAFCNDRQDDWVAMLPIVELCINTTPTQSRNGHTPMQVFQGFNPLVPADFLVPPSLQAASVAAQGRLAFHQQALTAARDAIQAAQDVSAAAFNRGRIDAPFQPGDWVRVKASHLVPPGERDDEVKTTLRRKWPGPFLIKRAVGHNAFELDLPIASYPNAHPVFNVSALKPDSTRRADEVASGASYASEDTQGVQVRVVDRIVLHRVRYRQHEFLVQWKGESAAHRTWQRIADFQDGTTTTQALLDFELTRVGDCRHVDASAPPVTYPRGPPGTSLTHEDGWMLFYAENNDTLKGIASRFNTDAAALLDFNVSTIDGLSVKAKLHSGTAVRVRCPARGDGAQGVPDLPDVGAG